MKHYSVLKREAIDGLQIKEDGIYVDATLGYAGDASEILKRIKRGKLFAFDRDEEALKYSDEVLQKLGNSYTLIHSDFVHMKEKLQELEIDKVDGILFDLGVSSPQLDENRGFSFMRDETLDMRMDRSSHITAQNIVNEYSYEKLKNIFYQYGEEKQSALIAKKIVEVRKNKQIKTTKELCDIICTAVGAKYYYKTHPERNIFQAIRIEVNEELTDLEKVLPDAISLLKPKGRLVVITFHSLEDRIVKQIFKKYSEVDKMVKGLPDIPLEYQPLIKLINKKPILPSEEELKENTRSASAKLRIVERI
mgnify:CR=1 FL=1